MQESIIVLLGLWGQSLSFSHPDLFLRASEHHRDEKVLNCHSRPGVVAHTFWEAEVGGSL